MIEVRFRTVRTKATNKSPSFEASDHVAPEEQSCPAHTGSTDIVFQVRDTRSGTCCTFFRTLVGKSDTNTMYQRTSIPNSKDSYVCFTIYKSTHVGQVFFAITFIPHKQDFRVVP